MCEVGFCGKVMNKQHLTCCRLLSSDWTEEQTASSMSGFLLF